MGPILTPRTPRMLRQTDRQLIVVLPYLQKDEIPLEYHFHVSIFLLALRLSGFFPESTSSPFHHPFKEHIIVFPQDSEGQAKKLFTDTL